MFVSGGGDWVGMLQQYPDNPRQAAREKMFRADAGWVRVRNRNEIVWNAIKAKIRIGNGNTVTNYLFKIPISYPWMGTLTTRNCGKLIRCRLFLLLTHSNSIRSYGIWGNCIWKETPNKSHCKLEKRQAGLLKWKECFILDGQNDRTDVFCLMSSLFNISYFEW